jgi:hypothetical protein
MDLDEVDNRDFFMEDLNAGNQEQSFFDRITPKEVLEILMDIAPSLFYVIKTYNILFS